jgi:hypothetical protein
MPGSDHTFGHGIAQAGHQYHFSHMPLIFAEIKVK